MSKYLFTGHYTNASWARLVKGYDDRATTFDTLLRSLDGSLDVMYWSVRNGAVRAIVELPDAMAAKAVVTAIVKTGAFTSVEVDELLSQDQLRDALALARAAEAFYEAPGTSAVVVPSVGD